MTGRLLAVDKEMKDYLSQISDAAKNMGDEEQPAEKHMGAQNSTAAPSADESSDLEATWKALAEVIRSFDRGMENRLAAASPEVAEAYQLGRGLAELRWSLNYNMDRDAAATWTEVFSRQRCLHLTEMLGRISQYFNHPLPAPVLAGSLTAWHLAAMEKSSLCPLLTSTSSGGPDAAQADSAIGAIDQQARRWYDLMIAGQDPASLLSPHALLKDWRLPFRAAGQFVWQLVGLLVGIGALAAAVVLSLEQSSVAGANPLRSVAVRSALAVAGALGVGASGLAANIKNRTQTLISRFRADIQRDLLITEFTALPKFPDLPDWKDWRNWKTSWQTRKSRQERHVSVEDHRTQRTDEIPIRTRQQFLRDAARHRPLN